VEAEPSRGASLSRRRRTSAGGHARPVRAVSELWGECGEPRPDDHDHDASCRDGEEEIEREGPCWRLKRGAGAEFFFFLGRFAACFLLVRSILSLAPGGGR